MKFARFVAPLLAIYLLSAAALAAVATSPLPSSAPVASPTESKVEALVEGGATGAASSATQRKVLASIASHGKATRPAPRAVSALSSISPSVVLRQQASSSSSLASTAAPTSQPSQSSPPAGAPALVLAGRGKFRRQPLSTADEDIRAKRMSPTRPLEFVVDKSFGRNGKSNRTRRIGEHRSKVGNESFEDSTSILGRIDSHVLQVQSNSHRSLHIRILFYSPPTVHEQQIKDDPFAVPFGYSIFAVLLISIVFGRKIYDMTRNKKVRVSSLLHLSPIFKVPFSLCISGSHPTCVCRTCGPTRS